MIIFKVKKDSKKVMLKNYFLYCFSFFILK